MSAPSSQTLPPQPPAQANPLVFQPRKVVEHITIGMDGVEMRFCYDLPDGSCYELNLEGYQISRNGTVRHLGDDIKNAREAAHRELRDILAGRMAALSAHDRLALASEQGGAA